MRINEIITESVAGPKKCWPGHRKVGTQPGTGKNKGKRVNDCEEIKEEPALDEEWSKKYKDSINCSNPKGFSQKAHYAGKQKNEELTLDEQFDIIEEMVNCLAESNAVDADVIWEDFESIDDDELCAISEDWQKANRKDKTAGMSRKAVKAYRRENPGSKLQTAVTTKPSKLKPGSKAAKRRKSFCARMKGNKGPMKKPNGKPTNKALALRRWNC